MKFTLTSLLIGLTAVFAQEQQVENNGIVATNVWDEAAAAVPVPEDQSHRELPNAPQS